MEQNKELVICTGLTKSYGPVKALDNLNLTLGRGRFVGLLGPNGSGKTTAIKLINGLIQPTSGAVTVDGAAPGIHTHSVISYLPDRDYLNDWMKVADLLDFFRGLFRGFRQGEGERYAEIARHRAAGAPQDAQQGHQGKGAAHPDHEPPGAAVYPR